MQHLVSFSFFILWIGSFWSWVICVLFWQSNSFWMVFIFTDHFTVPHLVSVRVYVKMIVPMQRNFFLHSTCGKTNEMRLHRYPSIQSAFKQNMVHIMVYWPMWRIATCRSLLHAEFFLAWAWASCAYNLSPLFCYEI